MQVRYRWEGAFSQDFAKSEVLWLLLAWLRGLDSRLCAEVWDLAAGRRSYSTGFWGWALHAGTVATACAWDSKWRAGVRVVSYHWWMRAGTDDNTGLNGHNIILKWEGKHSEYITQGYVVVDVTLNVKLKTHNTLCNLNGILSLKYYGGL